MWCLWVPVRTDAAACVGLIRIKALWQFTFSLLLVNAMQLLVEILSEQMVRLPVRFEDVEVPLWAESADDYKSSVVQFRSQVGAKV
jgi:hypothetical protein